MSHVIFVLDFSNVSDENDRSCDQKDHVSYTYPSCYVGFLWTELEAAIAIGCTSYPSS
jgi:hypothetical protein